METAWVNNDTIYSLNHLIHPFLAPKVLSGSSNCCLTMLAVDFILIIGASVLYEHLSAINIIISDDFCNQ